MADGNPSFLRAARAGNLDKVIEYLKGSIDINTSNMSGMNALHLASKEGNLEIVRELLRRGANVNAATQKGNTSLHIASLGGKLDVVKILMDNGANVNVQSVNGFTPLYMAAQENHENVVKYLLSHGANQSLATEEGFTPLAVALQQGHDRVVTILLENDTKGKVRLPALHIAAKKDDCKAAALLLQNDQRPDVTSKSGFTPLHIAAHYGNENIASLLLDKGANVNSQAKHQITPLHVAAKWGKSRMVTLLLDRGAKIDAATRDSLTPLHCAARSGHEPVIELLLKRGAPISTRTKNGLAPLHMASQGDHVDSARILLNYKAPVDAVTVDYLTALHVAAHCGHVKVAKLLLDHKAQVNARALNGFAPLHIACKKNRIAVVELLLKHGASIEVTTESGLTPLHVASFMGHMNIVLFLIQTGANVDVPTVRGETPIHLAARANQADIIRVLLRNGARVDAKAREEQTALHIASRLGNADIVTILLQSKASVDAATKDQYTALHIAAKEGREEVASALLDHGASLTNTTKKGFTPLHLAAKYGQIKVARMLLEKEAPVNAQGKNGVTPLHVATHYDHVKVALLLLEKKASPHATAKNGYTPLHIAAKKNQMDIATTLLDYGAKTNAESRAGFTPLHLAAQEGNTEMALLLMKNRANTNAKAKNELTPLHLCAQGDKTKVAEILIKNKAEVNAQTKTGYTPLHVASHFGQQNMVKLLIKHGAHVNKPTTQGYTPLHQAAQQGHPVVVSLLLDNKASPNETTSQGLTALAIAQKCNYISVVETLKTVTKTVKTTVKTTTTEEKYSYLAPETMQETFMTTDSEDEGAEEVGHWGDTHLRYEREENKDRHDDSMHMDVSYDEANTKTMIYPGTHAPLINEDGLIGQRIKVQEDMLENIKPDNIDISRPPVTMGFLVSFMVDARGGAMRGCRHSGVRVIIPPRKAPMPMRVTCRFLKKEKLIHPPPLMEGEACASRILEVGPAGARFLGPVIIEVPHFASLRNREREIIIMRSDNGQTWREHTLEASEEAVKEILSESFDKDTDLNALEPEFSSDRITRILTTDFPQFFAIVTRIRQEVHAIGPEGGMVNSTVIPQVQAIFPEGALTKKIKVGLQAQPIASELVTKMLGNRVAVSPIVTVEPRRRKFHKPITLTIPVPQAATRGMINQYSGDTPTLRLLCSITGGSLKAQWEDVTGSTPLTFVNNCVSFTTTVSARFWLMDCRQTNEATKYANELYREAIHVPFVAKFVIFTKRHDPSEAQIRVFCMTDDKEDKTLESQKNFTETAKSRDVEVLENKNQHLEFAGNLTPVTKSGDQLSLNFQAFRENRLPFLIRVKDPSQEPVGKIAFMRDPRKARGDPPQIPICNLNIRLPDNIVENDTSPYKSPLHHKELRKSSQADEDTMVKVDSSIMQMGHDLGKDWVKVATQLNLSHNDIEKIKAQFPNQVKEQAVAMLYTRKNFSSISQDLALCKALREAGRKDLASKYYHEPSFADDSSRMNGKMDNVTETFTSSKSVPLDRETSYDEKDIMKDAESMEESEGESVTAHQQQQQQTRQGRDEEENRALAVEEYLNFLEEQDREDSEERAAYRGETNNPKELFITKEEIPVPDSTSTGLRRSEDSESMDHARELPTQLRTEDRIEFTDDGGMTHTITQVTKTMILQDPTNVQTTPQQPVEYAKQVVESETWHSGEQDTSQVSVSSLPEDEESGPTATVSSATTVTTDEIVASTHANVTGDSGDTKITVEQNEPIGTEEYHRIAEKILQEVYREVDKYFRSKEDNVNKEWFEEGAAGDIVHVVEHKTTCETHPSSVSAEKDESQSDRKDAKQDSASPKMSFPEKKDYFRKLSDASSKRPVPKPLTSGRRTMFETESGHRKLSAEGEIIESVGPFQERRSVFETTDSTTVSTTTAASTKTTTSKPKTSFISKIASKIGGRSEPPKPPKRAQSLDSTGSRLISKIPGTSSDSKKATSKPGQRKSSIPEVDKKNDEKRKDGPKHAPSTTSSISSYKTNSSTSSSVSSSSLKDSKIVSSSKIATATITTTAKAISTIKSATTTTTATATTKSSTHSGEQSAITKLSPPESVDTKTVEQILSPVVDYSELLSTENQVKVGVSPTEEEHHPQQPDTVATSKSQPTRRTSITSNVHRDSSVSESIPECEEPLAFDNSGFEGAEAIDAREEMKDGVVSPFEVSREDIDRAGCQTDSGDGDRDTTAATVGSPSVSESMTEKSGQGDDIMDYDQQVTETVGHGQEQITSFVSDGSDFGVPIESGTILGSKSGSNKSDLLLGDEEVMRELDDERVVIESESGHEVDQKLRIAEVIEEEEEEEIEITKERLITGTEVSEKIHVHRQDSQDSSQKSSSIASSVIITKTTTKAETAISKSQQPDVKGDVDVDGRSKLMSASRLSKSLSKSDSEDSDDPKKLEKEATMLAREIVGKVTQEVANRPIVPMGQQTVDSVEISDEDLVEPGGEESVVLEPRDANDDVMRTIREAHAKAASLERASTSVCGVLEKDQMISPDKVIIKEIEFEEAKTETISKSFTSGETLVKEISSDSLDRSSGTDVVRLRNKNRENRQSLDDSVTRENRKSSDSDRLSTSMGTGGGAGTGTGGLSSTPSSDRKFQSCVSDIDSSRSTGSSRPTSGDFDHILPSSRGSGTGLSEYESCLTSQGGATSISYMTAASSQDTTLTTSTSYETAQSSRHSTISVDSDSCQLGELSSDASETLITGLSDHHHRQQDAGSRDKIAGDADDEDEDEDDEDGQSTPINDNSIKEPYEREIPEDVIRSGIEAPCMGQSLSSWEMVENKSHNTSPFELISTTTTTASTAASRNLDEFTETITCITTTKETITSVDIGGGDVPTGDLLEGTEMTSSFTAQLINLSTDDLAQPSTEDSSTWLSSDIGTAVNLANSNDASGNNSLENNNSTSATNQPTSSSSGEDYGNGCAGGGLIGHEGEGSGRREESSVVGESMEYMSSQYELGASNGPLAVDDHDPSSEATSTGAGIGGGVSLGGGNTSTSGISGSRNSDHHGSCISSSINSHESSEHNNATDTPLVSQSSIASSILSERARHQLSYDLSPEIPCPGASGESMIQATDSGDDRPMSPVPPADLGSSSIPPPPTTSIGQYEDDSYEKSPISEGEMFMLMTEDGMMMMGTSKDVAAIQAAQDPFPLTGDLYTHEEIDESVEDLMIISRRGGERKEGEGEREEGEDGARGGGDVDAGGSVRPQSAGITERSKPISVASRTSAGEDAGSSTGSSLQEFEKLEAEAKTRGSHGSLDSIGSFGSGKPSVGDRGRTEDGGSICSLTEFERLESECRQAEMIEKAVREEQARLSEIEEGHESQASDSQETLSGDGESDSDDDYEKRMTEIDDLMQKSESSLSASGHGPKGPGHSGESKDSGVIERRSAEVGRKLKKSKSSVVDKIVHSSIDNGGDGGSGRIETLKYDGNKFSAGNAMRLQDFNTRVISGSGSVENSQIHSSEEETKPGLSTSVHDEMNPMIMSTISIGLSSLLTDADQLESMEPALDSGEEVQPEVEDDLIRSQFVMMSSTDSSSDRPALMSMSSSIQSVPNDDEFDKTDMDFTSLGSVTQQPIFEDEGEVTPIAEQKSFPGAEKVAKKEEEDEGNLHNIHVDESLDDDGWQVVREVDLDGSVRTIRTLSRHHQRTASHEKASSSRKDDSEGDCSDKSGHSMQTGDEKFRAKLMRNNKTGQSIEHIIEQKTVDPSGNVRVVRTVRQESLEGPRIDSRSFHGPHSEQERRQFIQSFATLEPICQEETIETHDTSGQPMIIQREICIQPEVRTITFIGHDTDRDISDFTEHWSGDRCELQKVSTINRESASSSSSDDAHVHQHVDESKGSMDKQAKDDDNRPSSSDHN
ncbi:uncharacterized protein LOC141858216 isoform X5 [Brevipalpus obovatus]|uniref:uncharacterized protein LOC141858216 isoform X5 n=1 Tax=Brevipalpus obovatus TaxID=246614 RepID=UPI003D9EDAEF